MMVTANCVTKTTDHCRREEGFGITELTDRYHKVFPVMRNCTHCYNIIYNSVTHEMGFARNVSSKTVFMENGVVVEQAPSHEFFAHPREERTREFLRKIEHTA